MRLLQTDVTPRDAPPIPHVASAVAAAELEAMAAMRAAGETGAQQIKGAINDRSGNLSASVGVSVRRIAGGGVSVRFGAIKKVQFTSRKGSRVGRELYGAEGGKNKKQRAFYGHFVDQGTGVAGPLHRTINRKGLIPVAGGVREPSGTGQRPQRMFQRAQEQFITVTMPALDATVDADLTRRIEGGRR